MGQQYFKIALDASSFPMLSEQQTRTIIGAKSATNNSAANSNFAPVKTERPGLQYCHNVMPSLYGYDSIGYTEAVPAAPVPVGKSFVDVRIIYGTERTRFYLGFDNEGGTYILEPNTYIWSQITLGTADPTFTPDTITIGTVNGISYIFYKGFVCVVYNETTQVFDTVPLVGIDEATILGLTASSGYLIAYTESDLAWSSLIDPADFTPSDITGAGGGKISDIAGEIKYGVSNSVGVIFYAAANAVAAVYTGNIRYPFKLREIDGSKGGINLGRTAYEDNGAQQFVYTKAGLQSISDKAAAVILPEVTDFLAGRKIETYNPFSREYEYTEVPQGETLGKHINYIASRYLVISYGIGADETNSHTHALVFDTALGKLGKLLIDHVDVFEFIGDQSEISKENIAFCKADGSVHLLDFSAEVATLGVCILGKLQYVRSRFIELQRVEVENVPLGPSFQVYSLVSLDGKTGIAADGAELSRDENYVNYGFRATGKNHSLVFNGSFNLVTAQVTYVTAGNR